MNFIDFLLKYYVWIIVVLIILIVTIIGFLADKRLQIRKKKKGEKVDAVQNNEQVNEPTSLQPENIFKESEKVNNEGNVNSFGFVPLSDQKPSIAPKVEQNLNNNIGEVTPQMQTSGPMPGAPVPPVSERINSWEQKPVEPVTPQMVNPGPMPGTPVPPVSEPINSWEQKPVEPVTPQMQTPGTMPGTPVSPVSEPINSWGPTPSVVPTPVEPPQQVNAAMGQNVSQPVNASVPNTDNTDISNMFVTGNNN